MSAHEEDKEYRQFDWRLMKRFLVYLRPHRRWVALAGLLVLSGVLLRLAAPVVVKGAIDGPIAHHDAAGLGYYMAIFLAVGAGLTLVKYAEELVTTLAGQRIIRDVRMEVFGHLQRQPIRFFQSHPVGRLTTRLTNDVEALNEMFTSGLVWLAMDLVMLAGLTGMMFWLSWRLALATFALSPLALVGLWLFRRFARHYFREMRRQLAALGAMLHELIAGMSVVQLFGQEERVRHRYGERDEEYLHTGLRATVVHSFFFAGAQMAGALALAVLIGYGAAMVGEGAMSLGGLVAFAYTAQKFFEPIHDMSEKFTILQSAMAASERLFGMLDLPAEDPGAGAPTPARGHVEFDAVHFSYDGKTPVLQGVSFSIAPGQCVALVGLTGAGKTTLAHLLERFWDPTGGAIRVDGLELARYDRRALRRAMAIVSQEPFLFRRSVRENIGPGAVEAAQAAQAHDFITALPQGYDTPLAERAATLSTGQRQLISIARALASDPRILILDEATASVDPETERRIQAGVEKLLQGRTALIIAHRLATVRRADRIVVLHHGRVKEEGTHDQLMAAEGLYAQMVRLNLWERTTASS